MVYCNEQEKENDMSNIFELLDEDRESELKGEKVTKEQVPFSPALLVDVSIGQNFFGANCLDFVLVNPKELGKYFQYNVEVADRKVRDELKSKGDEKSKKRLIGINMSILGINKHLYELTGTAKTESLQSALGLLQAALKEKSIEVDIEFNENKGEKFTNYYFREIKGIGFRDPVSSKIVELIKEDIDQRKQASSKKKAIEKPNQYYEQVVQAKITEEEDVPF